MTDAEIKLVQDFFSLIEKVMIGVAAIVGSVLVQRESNEWSRRRDDKKLLQQKAERLVTEILSQEIWITHLQEQVLSDETPRRDGPEPSVHIETLFRLYFPSLERERSALNKSLLKLLTCMKDRDIMSDPEMWKRLLGEHLDVSRGCIAAISRHMRKNLSIAR